jgi:cystinosin
MAYYFADDSSPLLLGEYGKQPLLMNQWKRRQDQHRGDEDGDYEEEEEEEGGEIIAKRQGFFIAVEDVSDTTLVEASTSSTPMSWRRKDRGGMHPLRSVLSRVFTFLSDDSGDPEHMYRGLGTVVVMGILLGVVFPNRRNQLPGRWYPHLSSMIGYTYVTAWSLSFYPQLLSNLRNRHTEGLSSDFCYLNVLGFLCYTIFNLSMAYSPTLQAQYAARHNGLRIHIAPNDIAFAIHALLLSTVWVIQIWYYQHLPTQPSHLTSSSPSQSASKVTLLAIAAIVIVIIIYASLILTLPNSSSHALTSWWNWLDFMYTLANIKVAITVVKYCPQVLLNCRRKSTEGWNIWNILLDFMGGILSITQLILDSWCTTHDFWSGVSGYPAKFMLGLVSILFDVSFSIFELSH